MLMLGTSFLPTTSIILNDSENTIRSLQVAAELPVGDGEQFKAGIMKN